MICNMGPLELITLAANGYQNLYDDAIRETTKAGLTKEFAHRYWAFKEQDFRKQHGTTIVKNMLLFDGPAFYFCNRLREKASWINVNVIDFAHRYRDRELTNRDRVLLSHWEKIHDMPVRRLEDKVRYNQL